MKVWRGIGALLSAGMLMLSAVGFAMAAPPTYTIGVVMSADPANVPPSGGDVTFTVLVTATGSGFFQAVSTSNSLAGCSIAGPFGDQPTGPSAGRLDSGETWTYTCSVTDVVPGTTSTGTVHACHNMGTDCNQAAHDATGQGQVTLGDGTEPTEVPPTEVPPTEVPPTEVPPTEVPPTEVPPTEVPPTEVPPTEVPPTEVPPTEIPPTEVPPTQAPPTDSPGSDVPSSEDPGSEPSFEGAVGGIVDSNATQPNTDSVVRRAMSSGPNQSFWLIVGVLGLLVGAIVLVSPPRSARRR
jgi:hypothetical protein